MQELSAFIGGSVLPATNRVYEGHWIMWKAFLKSEINDDDPFLTTVEEKEKAPLVCLMMLRRHQAGHRGKAATAFTAGVRMRFSQNSQPTTFLDSTMIATSRVSCRLNPGELRTKRNSGLGSSAKLPVCEGVLTSMRIQQWAGRSWDDSDMLQKMIYLGCMWGFEMGARISEYTKAEPGSSDHCVRTDDLTFDVRTATETRRLVASQLRGLILPGVNRPQVLECSVLGASSKGKVTVKAKVIGRRSTEEEQFLEDIIDFVLNSGAKGDEELFSFRTKGGSRVILRGKEVRVNVKNVCKEKGLPPLRFSSHSLRKATITHMRAMGASEDDRRDRGSYSAGSQVMNNTYDYATGLGPSASNSLVGGHKPTIEDVKRLIPATR